MTESEAPVRQMRPLIAVVMGTAIAGGIAAAIIMPRLYEVSAVRDERTRKPRLVETVVVQAAPWTIDLALDGTAVPLVSQQIHARSPGLVDSVGVSLGEHVTRGQALASMAVTLPATADAPAMSAVDTIIAPFDGVVTRRNVDVGAQVTADTGPLFEVADVGTLRVHVDVPQTLAPWVKVGESVAVTARAVSFATITGRVVRTAGALDRETQTLRIEVHMPGERLLAGSSVTVRFSVKRDVTPPMIPARALVFGTKWPRVVRLVDGRARYAQVDLGWDRGGEVEVASGLEVGDIVVVSPPENIRENELLNVEEAKTTAAR